jgi:hypothetical protein
VGDEVGDGVAAATRTATRGSGPDVADATHATVATSPRLLRADTIVGIPLTARIVVLSSCESAGGEALAGEGVAGLANAFLAAGAGAVLATLWPVDDLATERFMHAYYRALGRGASAAVALRDAQRQVRTRRAWRHPYYWAGFVLVGDGDVTLALRENPWSRERAGLALAGLLLAGSVVAAVGARRRARVSRGAA